VYQGVEHCQQLASIVNASANFEIVTPPSLALLVVRLREPLAPNSSDEVLNSLNQALYAKLDARHDVMLTQTVLKSVESEVHCLRIAMGGVNTTMKDVKEVWQVIESEGQQVLEEFRSQRELEI
jgi:aromatic-L-amino-acid decarboxylase